MPIIDMQDYNPAARRYWWTITLLGMGALAYSIASVVAVDGKFLLQVLAGAVVAAIVGLFPVRVPGSKTSIAGAEIFIFLVMLLYGTEAAVIAAALEGFVASWRTSKRWTSRIGTPSMAALAMFVCGSGFALVREQAGHLGNALLLASLFTMAALYFVANTLLLSTVFALKTQAPIRPLRWLRDLGWLGLAYLTGAA